MKTTVEIPDVTFRLAKTFAASRGITLKRLFTEAIEERLRQGANETRTRATPAPWMAGFGALSDFSDENRRILDTIGEEFEKLTPEDIA